MFTECLQVLTYFTVLRLTTAFTPITPSQYKLTYDYQGDAVFDEFDFFTERDPTNGQVQYVKKETAISKDLVGFMPDFAANNDTAPFYLGVDYTTNDTRIGRPSIRISSKQTFNHALFIADIAHMPSATCGAWPAYWLLGSGAEWPAAGEIDILEGVNDDAFNKYTLHTVPGIVTANHTTSMKGRLVTPNCDVNAEGQMKNAGCSIVDGDGIDSYGQPFNDAKGGVFATLLDEQGVRIWFFPRNAIPADIVSETPNPPPHGSAASTNTTGSAPASTWPLPNAYFNSPENKADAFTTHFKDMKIIINISFCGDWAAKAWNSSETCKALTPTCEEYVTYNPSAFTDVYWAFNSIKVYEAQGEGE